MMTTCRDTLAETASPVAACPLRRARAPIDYASLLIALALVADALAGQQSLRSVAPWLVAGAYLGAVALAAWTRRDVVELLAISGVLLPLALGDVSTRLIATACVLAAILAGAVFVRRRTRKYYDSPPAILFTASLGRRARRVPTRGTRSR